MEYRQNNNKNLTPDSFYISIFSTDILPTPSSPLAEHPRSGVERPGSIALKGVKGDLSPCPDAQALPLSVDQGPTKDQPRYLDIQLNKTSGDKLTPGYAESYPVCGDVRFKILCPDQPDHYTTLARYSCHRPACPVCYPIWIGEQAKRAAYRIEGFQDATGYPYLPRHISFSPDPSKFPYREPTTEALQYLYEKGRDIAAAAGIIAAVIIPHPYRIKKEFQQSISQAADREGINRYEYTLKQTNWKDLVTFSPHIHIIGYGHLVTSSDLYKKAGWTYRNHTPTGKKGLKGEHLQRTLAYLLTHTWARGNHKILRYVLGMSTHHLTQVDHGYRTEQILCPTCQAHCVAINEDGQYQDLHNAPHANRKVLNRPTFLIRRSNGSKGVILCSSSNPTLKDFIVENATGNNTS